MWRRILLSSLLALPVAMGFAADAPVAPPKRVHVVVMPVRDQIAAPEFFILRRGLKDAELEQAGLVVLDMKTPGGELDATFDIMEALDKFSGQTITFVNKEAMSAGAFISAATTEIYFVPNGVIGAAAPVLSTGGEVDKTMKQKIVSYLRARMRASSEGKGYRGQVISAMIDEDYELKIGEKVLKPKGELLSLTATEAMEKYGEPPQALLGAGKAADITSLLTAKFGANGYDLRQFKVTWSEELAQSMVEAEKAPAASEAKVITVPFQAHNHGGDLLSLTTLAALVGGGLALWTPPRRSWGKGPRNCWRGPVSPRKNSR